MESENNMLGQDHDLEQTASGGGEYLDLQQRWC